MRYGSRAESVRESNWFQFDEAATDRRMRGNP